MNFLSLIRVELTKIKRSHIFPILFAAVIILWIPSVLNADMNFSMQAEGISPEHNFFIQGFLGMVWFMLPASMVVGTVLLHMTERTHRGILKMLSLPIHPARLCLAKFVVLLLLSAVQILLCIAVYYVSAAIASQTQNYQFLLSPLFVFREAGKIFLTTIPMLSVFWLLSVCIQTPVFSIGAGLASIVPSVLIINTKWWFAYPPAYPLFIVTADYGRLAEHLSTAQIELSPWIPSAAAITIICLLTACLLFGRTERR